MYRHPVEGLEFVGQSVARVLISRDLTSRRNGAFLCKQDLVELNERHTAADAISAGMTAAPAATSWWSLC